MLTKLDAIGGGSGRG